MLDRLNKLGTTEFIPNFKTEFAPVIKVVADAVKDIIDKESEILLMNLPVNIDGTPVVPNLLRRSSTRPTEILFISIAG